MNTLPGSGSIKNFYPNQRYGPRGGYDAEQVQQVQQAKRLMAAQRERELRNQHMEQQFNRSMPGPSA